MYLLYIIVLSFIIMLLCIQEKFLLLSTLDSSRKKDSLQLYVGALKWVLQKWYTFNLI